MTISQTFQLFQIQLSEIALNLFTQDPNIKLAYYCLTVGQIRVCTLTQGRTACDVGVLLGGRPCRRASNKYMDETINSIRHKLLPIRDVTHY